MLASPATLRTFYRFISALILLPPTVVTTFGMVTNANTNIPPGRFQLSQELFESTPSRGPSSLPVPNPTKSFWIDSSPDVNPLAKEGSQGPLTKDADICIIGSGISGVSAAYHISQLVKESGSNENLSVVILEARDFCSGATGRNGGHLTPYMFHDFQHHLTLYGHDQALRSKLLENYTASEIVKLVEKHSLVDAVDLVAGGHTELILSPAEEALARADYEAAKEAGIDLSRAEWYEKKDMEKKYGTSHPGVWFPGHNLWPLKFVTHLYKIANSSTSSFSLSIHTSTPVTSISPIPETTSPSRRWTLETPRGPISCTSVIHTTNGYASHLLPQFSGPSGIVPVRGQVVALRAAVDLEELTKSGWSGNEGFEYWFPRPVKSQSESSIQPVSGQQQQIPLHIGSDNGNQNPLVILGGGREALEEYEIYTTDDSVLEPDAGKVLREFLPTFFPGKYEPGREPEMEWTGIMGFTKMGDPFVGPVPDESTNAGQFISAGFSGHGMPRTYACSEALAQIVWAELRGKLGEWKIPEWLPERYLTWSPLRKLGN